MTGTHNPITLSGLDHVVVRVRDLDAALHFYRDVLGCTEERAVADAGLYQLRAGSALIDLVPLDGRLGQQFDEPDPDCPNVDHFCLRIEPWDADAIRTHLDQHGIEVSPVERRYGAEGFGPSIYIRDPDGNTVELKGPANEPAASC